MGKVPSIESCYKHPHREASFVGEDVYIYRTHPNHGVRVVRASPTQFVVSHVEYSAGELQPSKQYDLYGPSDPQTMYTDVKSDITEFIDQITETYLQESRLSELMIECL